MSLEVFLSFIFVIARLQQIKILIDLCDRHLLHKGRRSETTKVIMKKKILKLSLHKSTFRTMKTHSGQCFTVRYHLLALGVTTAIILSSVVSASDPDLTSDFKVPEGTNASLIDGNFFTFSGLRNFSAPVGAFGSKKVTLVELPALDGLGVGVTILDFNPGSVNPPHSHPRGTELLYLMNGSLHVGLLDSTGKLYTQVLESGDLFVFPKGMVHYQMNLSPDQMARGLGAFSSSNAGTNALPTLLFGSGIASNVLEKAFKISSDTLAELEEPFKPKRH